MNGSTYIGSGADLTRRFTDYFSPKWLIKETLKNNSIIYRALLKNGNSNFRLEILVSKTKFFFWNLWDPATHP